MLLILKIIGITVLAILGLLLLFVLVVLFVPLRYSFSMEKPLEQKPGVQFRLRWLLYALQFRLDYEEELAYSLRIFGYPFLDSTKEKEDVKVEQDKEIKRTKKKKEKEEKQEQDNKAEEHVKKAEDAPKEPRKEQNSKEHNKKEHNKKEHKECEHSDDFKEDEQEFAHDKQNKKGHTKKENVFQRLKKKIETWKEKLLKLIKNAKEWKQGWEKKVESLQQKAELLSEFCNSKENKAGVARIFATVKKFLKHLAPRKWKGEIRYGADNPATTGKLMGVLAVLYSWTGVLVNVTPDFEEKIFQGQYKAKGRIYLGYVLGIVLSLWFCEEFKGLKKNYEKVRRRW